MAKPKVKMVCSECGSEDVLADAYAEWDYDAQEWVVQNTFDKGAYCNACDGETRIEEVEDRGDEVHYRDMVGGSGGKE